MRDELHAVFAVDPGGTTGVAAGYVEPLGSTKETLTRMDMAKAVEVAGGWAVQGRQLAAMTKRFVFKANVEMQLPLANVHLVCEDFVLRRRMAGGATGTLTSCWVAAAWVGYAGLESEDVDWQQASQAKSFANDDRLRLWGLWEVGSAHKRDAWRHFALKVNKVVP